MRHATLGRRMLVLASASPRRAALLLAVGLEFRVERADVDETLPAGPVPGAAIAVAERKLNAVASRCPGDVVVAADTIVALGDDAFGKPASPDDALRILRRLQGRTHHVVTGVVVQGADGRRFASHVETEVELAPLDDDRLRDYVATGEPMDKAGAYAVQGRGAALVRAVRGDYTNVVGLPIRRTLELLNAAGHALPPHLQPS